MDENKLNELKQEITEEIRTLIGYYTEQGEEFQGNVLGLNEAIDVVEEKFLFSKYR